MLNGSERVDKQSKFLFSLGVVNIFNDKYISVIKKSPGEFECIKANISAGGWGGHTSKGNRLTGRRVVRYHTQRDNKYDRLKLKGNGKKILKKIL